jgi:hypothetical protein
MLNTRGGQLLGSGRSCYSPILLFGKEEKLLQNGSHHDSNFHTTVFTHSNLSLSRT